MQPIVRIYCGGAVRQQLVCALLLLAGLSPFCMRAQERKVLAATVLTSSADIALPVSQPLPNLTLELKRTPTQQAALDDFLAAAEQPGSAMYRKWLTPVQFAMQFAPSPERVEAARQWLALQGFQVGATSAGGMRIRFSGTALQLNRAFGVTLRTSRPGDLSRIAPDQPPTVPTALGDVIQELNGFNTFNRIDADSSALFTDAIESNSQSIVTLTADVPAKELTPLLEQAAAQGITVLYAGKQGTGAAARVTVLRVSMAGTDPASSASVRSTTPRPDWQSAPDLPEDTFRAAPDAEVVDVHAFATALQGLNAQRGERLGELAPALYRLASGHDIFTHADPALSPGTWSPTDGLGKISISALLKALATGSQASNLSLTASSNTVTHGQALTLSFTATGASATPTGTVIATLKDRSNSAVTTLGPATLSATGTATLGTSTLPGDLYDLSGNYSGDATYAANTSNATAITVNPEAAIIAATVPPATVAVGGVVPVTVTMSSASGVGIPSGTVAVNAFGTAVAGNTYTATLTAGTGSSATAVVSVPATDAGSFTFQASCTGNASFSCSKPADIPVTVAKGTPAVTLTSTATPAAVANSATTPYNLVASVAAVAGSNSNAPVPGGKVQVTDNGTSVANFNLVSGKGAYTLSLGGMAHSLVAVYSGDANYGTTSSAAVIIAGTSVTTTTTITTAVTSTSFGTAVPLTASVTPASYAASGAPAGTVTFTSSLQGVIGSARLGNGFVTYSPNTLIAGTHTITASFAPDSTDYAASATIAGVTIAITTAKVNTTTTVSLSPNPPFANQITTLTATVVANASTGASTPPPFTGTTSFFQNGVFLAQALVTGNTATASVRLAPGAPIPVTASYNGDTSYFGSTSAVVVVTPVRVAASISLSSNLNTPNADSTVVLTANVIAANTMATTVPTGSITFYDTHGGVVVTLGTITLSANGSNAAFATFQVNGLAAGLHAIIAKYSGDTAFTDASSNAVALSFGDYSVSFAPASIRVARGSSASATATLSVNNSFGGTVVFGCTPSAASNLTCSFSPASLTGGGQTTLTIGTSTTGTSAVPVRSSAKRETVPTGIAMAGLLAFLLSTHRRYRQMGALLLLFCSVALMSEGCSAGIVGSTNNSDGGSSLPVGGGGSTPTGGTPYGTFLLSVMTSSTDNSLRHSYSYSVTVQ